MRTSSPALPLLVALMLLLGGCDGGVDPVDTSVPAGRYLFTDLSRQGDLEVERRSAIVLFSQDEGTIYDTTYLIRNGDRTIDTIRETRLDFVNGGAGYQRAVEVHLRNGVAVDTTTHYWRFFRRGDSLFYYMGDRFTGTNIGLEGIWASEPEDSSVTGWRTHLNFRGDSVEVRHDPAVGGGMGTFAYKGERNILTVSGGTPFTGDRYQIIPGWALYITTRAVGGYTRAR